MAVLYIIGTPIGNLDDLSFRALETLKNAGLVACEDTRQTLKLLSHYGISVKMISCRAQNEKFAAEKVISALKGGTNVAYLSDAGTPAMSDPGTVLVRLATEAGFEAVPIPGPSAFASLVSVSGGMDKTVIFEGFLSPKPGRRRARLRELLDTGAAFVLYESPFRVLKLFEDLADLDKGRYVCVGKEMTKLHESYFRGTVEKIRLTLTEKSGINEVRGEFSVYVSGRTGTASGQEP